MRCATFHFEAFVITILNLILVESAGKSIGNPACWDAHFTFELCCGGDRSTFTRHGCASAHHNYELCCEAKYTPSELCLSSEMSDDVLWYCRARPHVEFSRCLGAPPIDRLGLPSVALFHRSYRDYTHAQTTKSEDELHMMFADERILDVIALYLKKYFLPGSSHRVGRRSTISGLCHGAKTGNEVRALRTKLQSYEGFETINMLGTDIAPAAVGFSTGDVVESDFHELNTSWLASWDFIYTNALDHSYYPSDALAAWRLSLREPASLVIIHRSPLHDVNTADGVDLYGGSVGDYCSLLWEAGFEIIDLIRVPFFARDDLIFATKGSALERPFKPTWTWREP